MEADSNLWKSENQILRGACPERCEGLRTTINVIPSEAGGPNLEESLFCHFLKPAYVWLKPNAAVSKVELLRDFHPQRHLAAQL